MDQHLQSRRRPIEHARRGRQGHGKGCRACEEDSGDLVGGIEETARGFSSVSFPLGPIPRSWSLSMSRVEWSASMSRVEWSVTMSHVEWVRPGLMWAGCPHPQGTRYEACSEWGEGTP